MVALQILVLSVWVRVLVEQLTRKARQRVDTLSFCTYTECLFNEHGGTRKTRKDFLTNTEEHGKHGGLFLHGIFFERTRTDTEIH